MMKYYFIYVISYFSLSILSIFINELLSFPPGVSPNIFVQIGCVAFFIKKVYNIERLKYTKIILLPLFFSGTAIVFLYFMEIFFLEWRQAGKEITPFVLTVVFLVNYFVGIVTTLYISSSKKIIQ